MSQREDTGYDDDGVDVSVGVGVSAVVGVGVDVQGVSLGVSLGVGLVGASPPLTSLASDSSEIWESGYFNYCDHLSS